MSWVRAGIRVLVLGLALIVPAQAEATRLKDIVDFEGVRDNMLVGYGLVVGLAGTGDSLNNSPFTERTLVAMLERLGVNTRGDNLRTQNVAAVVVTATLPPFAAQGSRIDVNVSTLGNAKSLLGGTLLVTPLLGADGEVYAVAQGPLVAGGFSAAGEAESVQRGVPTSARIASGAIVEREIAFELASMELMRLSLRNPDFTTAQRISTAINKKFGGDIAEARDPATVAIRMPDQARGNLVGFMTELEQLTVQPDLRARIVIDEASGVIVMGDNVRISTVAIAQGNLTIRITETPQVSQPNPLAPAGAETVTVPRTAVDIEDTGEARMALLPSGVTLQDLVANLNALGISPRDLITILQSIKAAGALQAEIEVL